MLQPLKFEFKMKHEGSNQEKAERALSNTCTNPYMPLLSVTQEEKTGLETYPRKRRKIHYYLRQTMLKNNLQ